MYCIGVSESVKVYAPNGSRMEKYGVMAVADAEAREITGEGVVVEKDGQPSLLEADTVVLATGYQANRVLLEQLKERQGMPEVYAIGDCVEPRKAIDAIREGFEIGWRI